MNPLRDEKIKAKTGGGGTDDTCDHGMSRSWKADVSEKKQYTVIIMKG